MSEAIAAIQSLPQGLDANTSVNSAHDPKAESFMSSLNSALEQVSHAEEVSAQENRALIEGKPGSSLESALTASARARVGWNAAVAVRNNVVDAYSTIMNMPV